MCWGSSPLGSSMPGQVFALDFVPSYSHLSFVSLEHRFKVQELYVQVAKRYKSKGKDDGKF